MKKLDLYILKKFLPLFVAAFFICLFVFMMQFTWRYMDELIGKGLSLDVLGQFFWYMAVTLVPMSLPLAVLLASLITFGNMGEQLELLSMKAAGVPLIRIMRPILIVVIMVTGTSFYFQNFTSPQAQISMQTLLFSMKQAQPAVEIPEGVFYNEIPDLNLYVQRKNAETGMLYQVIIYKTDQGFDKAQIVLADSGRLEMSEDKLHLKLDLWSGTQSEAWQQGGVSAMGSIKLPFDRETFNYKQVIIDFDSNFALMDKNMLNNMPQAKNMRQIETSVDSIESSLDSIGQRFYDDMKLRWYRVPNLSEQQTKSLARMKAVPFDTLLSSMSPDRLQTAKTRAAGDIRSIRSELEWKSVMSGEGDSNIRRHWKEWHQKMTLSLACLFFFFVGAPLGAIIRKGGLGLPAVISVLIFIFYYIIDTSGMKMARDGSWNMIYGMWISSAVLIPFGVFLTYKSNKDSVMFNSELYAAFFRQLLGLRSSRHINRKEVIINETNYDRLPAEIDRLREGCHEYAQAANLMSAPNYFHIFFRHTTDSRVEKLGEQMDKIVEELSNSREPQVLAETNRLPIIYAHAHISPFTSREANMAAGIFFPVGLILWARIWRFRLRLLRDLRQIEKTCMRLNLIINTLNKPEQAVTEEAEETLPTHKKHRRREWAIAIIVILLAFAGGWYTYRHFRNNRPDKPIKTKKTIPTSIPENSSGRTLPMPKPLKQS